MQRLSFLVVALFVAAAACGGDSDVTDTTLRLASAASNSSGTTSADSAQVTGSPEATEVSGSGTSIPSESASSTTLAGGDTTTSTSATATTDAAGGSTTTTTDGSDSTTSTTAGTSGSTTTTTSAATGTTTTTVLAMPRSIADLPILPSAKFTSEQQQELDAATVNVLLPDQPELFEFFEPIAGDGWYMVTAELPGDAFLFVIGEELLAEPENGEFELDYTSLEGFWEVLFHADGVEYFVSVECDLDNDSRCADNSYINALFTSLSLYR